MPPRSNLAKAAVCLTPAATPTPPSPPGPDYFDPGLPSPITTAGVIITGPITLKWACINFAKGRPMPPGVR